MDKRPTIWGFPVRMDAALRPGEWRVEYDEAVETPSSALEGAEKARIQAESEAVLRRRLPPDPALLTELADPRLVQLGRRDLA